MTKFELDETYKKIIDHLKEDGRASYSEIAEKLDVSESTVRKRVKKLIKNDVIERFTIKLNPESQEKGVTSFLTIVPAQSDQSIKDIAGAIVEFPEVEEAFYMSGKCGLLVKVRVSNLGKLDELIDKIRNLQGINEIESCIVLRELKRGIT
ncbi:MAG: AsnC family transcriptional regulator [Candidatus Lokiarchaeota archaeon]|nr:AsnC family transcriptional regulator [Candidatus Lokiarchaeota archaeon]